MVSGITNSDSLPTVNVTINDFGLRIAPPNPGPKLTIIGRFKGASDGLIPMNEPMLIDNIGVAMRNLRNQTDSSPSELTLAIEEAVAAGANNIEVVVTDTSVITPYSGSAAGTDATSLYTKLASTYTKLQHHEVDIVHVCGAYADGLHSGTGGTDAMTSKSFVKQLGDFCYQLTKESNSAFGVIGITPLAHVAKQLLWKDGSTTSVVDFTSTTGAWFMTPSLAFVNEYVKYLTHEAGDTGIFNNGGDSYTSATFTAGTTFWHDYLLGSATGTTVGLPKSDYIDTFQAKESDLTTDAIDGDGNKVDVGAYVSVVGGVARAFGSEAQKFAAAKGAGTVNYVNSNGAAAYAGLLSASQPHIGITNKPLIPLAQARTLGGAQARTLLQHRIVALMQKAGGYVVTSGITGAFNAGVASRSDYTRVTTIRTTQAMGEIIRDAGEAFIGKPISGPFLAALESAIDTNMQRALRRGAIRSYDFAISSTPDQQVLGEVTINLSMVPAFELVTINTTISLAKGEGIG